MNEVRMYKPLKKFLEAQGYSVHSEVESIDVLAKKDDEIMIVEMKTAFNLQLVYQLINRLKITKDVYAYVPLGKGGRWAKSYKRMYSLLRRLEVGLITLDQRAGKKIVAIDFPPKEFTKRKNYTKKKSALKEFDNRSVDLNEAGSTRTKIFTAYKEKAIRVGMFIHQRGQISTKLIREELKIERALDILNKNYYYWFERVERGLYKTTPGFEQFLCEHKDKIERLR